LVLPPFIANRLPGFSVLAITQDFKKEVLYG
jgi:hypothetical protein